MHQEAAPGKDRAHPLDWVLDRAIAPVHETRVWSDEPRPPAPPRGRHDRATRTTVTATELGDRIKSLCGSGWSNGEVLEVADEEPILPVALGKESVKRYVAILADEGDCRRWAARFPRFRFLTGSLDYALQSLGARFDRVIITPCLNSPREMPLDAIATAVERRGFVLLRVRAGKCESWTGWRAALHRVHLRIVRKEAFPDGTSILVTQRK